jgi:hypothetical protein
MITRCKNDFIDSCVGFGFCKKQKHVSLDNGKHKCEACKRAEGIKRSMKSIIIYLEKKPYRYCKWCEGVLGKGKQKFCSTGCGDKHYKSRHIKIK